MYKNSLNPFGNIQSPFREQYRPKAITFSFPWSEIHVIFVPFQLKKILKESNQELLVIKRTNSVYKTSLSPFGNIQSPFREPYRPKAITFNFPWSEIRVNFVPFQLKNIIKESNQELWVIKRTNSVYKTSLSPFGNIQSPFREQYRPKVITFSFPWSEIRVIFMPFS